jgi:hypothetical protein
MAVTKQAYASAAAPWAATSVCDDLRDAFIGAGLMAAWHDSFAAGGREHRVLEVVYNGSKAYGKTYYWFTVSTTGIWVRTSTGWNTGSGIPSGPGVAGTQYVDWYDTNTSALNGAARMIELLTSISFSVTRYTASGRTFFVLRAGTTFCTFTIDPASTTFRSFYDLDLGYHSGIYLVEIPGNRSVRFRQIHRNRRDLLLGSSINSDTEQYYYGVFIVVNQYCIPNTGTTGTGFTFPDSGFLLPGWTTTANPSAGTNFNPVFNAIRLTSIHAADMPTDFGIASIKVSNTLAIQDNATVTAGTEEYEILQFANLGFINTGLTSNPVFLARTV